MTERNGLAGDWEDFGGQGMIETKPLKDFLADVWSEKVQIGKDAPLEELVEAAIHYGCFAPGASVDDATEFVVRALEEDAAT